jgi:hypothetical protein
MSDRVSTARLLIAGGVSALLLSACVVAPPRTEVVYRSYPTYSTAPGDTVLVDMAPPAPVVEVVPPVPFVGAVWVNGFWGWSGSRHVWTAGHYIRPLAGHRWVPHRWEPVNGRWVLRGGFWMR